MDSRFPLMLDPFSCGVAEIRAFGKDYPKPLVGFFDNANDIAKAVKEINGGRDIFVGLNPRKRDLLERMPNRLGSCEGGKEADIVCRRWFLIDVDPERPKSSNSTDEEFGLARGVAKAIGEFLKSKGIPYAGALSGNGCHLLIRLPDYPVSKEIHDKHSLLLRWFDRRFGNERAKVDVAVHDAPRISRLYGTLNVKGEHTQERPQRMAKLLTETPPVTVDLFKMLTEEIENQRAFEMPRPTEVLRDKGAFSAFKGNLKTLDIVALFQKQNCYRKALQGGKHSVICPWASEHSTDGDTSTVIWEAEGDRWPSFHCSHSHCHGRSIREVLDFFGSVVVDGCCRDIFYRSTELTKNKSTPSTKKMVLTSVHELLAEAEEKVDWIVEGLLPKGGISVIAAKPKAGKSTLARQLAFCVSRGEPFLSRATEKGTVVYLALEERRGNVRGHFKDMGVTGDEDIRIFVGMAPQDAIHQVQEMAITEKPVLIIVDTLARIARIRDLNDYSQTTSGLEPLLAISREAGAHVCLLHHAKKGDSKGQDAVLGSTGIVATVDTAIQIHRGEKYRTISSTQREGDDIEETVLEFNLQRRWATLGGSREQAEIDRAKNAILEFLEGQVEAITENIIDESVDGNRSHRKKALRLLVDEGEIERTGGGKKNSPYFYKKTGILVPSISSEPENQNQKNDVTYQNNTTNSGSQNVANSDSDNVELQERISIMEEDGGLSHEEAVKAAQSILGAEVVA